MLLKKIISGFEYGDTAAVVFATECGFEIDGYKVNRHPDAIELNIMDSDGILRLSFDFNSTTEKQVLKYINRYKKPHIDIILGNLNKVNMQDNIDQFNKFLINNKISVLNIVDGGYESYNAALNFLRLWYTNSKIWVNNAT